MKAFDFVALGGGSAGLTAASLVKAAGKSVAVVDSGSIGGLCSLNGCNPKKALVRCTEFWQEIQNAAEFGIDVQSARLDWGRVIDRKDGITANVTTNAEKSLADQQIELIKGKPRFIANDAIEVNGERIQAAGFVIATGSHPRPLEFPGAEHVSISDDLLALRTPPHHLFIVGAGVVAMEIGQVYARAGSHVTVATPGKDLLGGSDPELVATLLKDSRSLGMEFLFDTAVQSVSEDGSRLRIELRHGKTMQADVVLNAAGRLASIQDLDLSQAGIRFSPRGVKVDRFLKTSNPAVYAAGDAHGLLQLSPIASYEGKIVARNFLQPDSEAVDYAAIPTSVFTVPPLASVGLSEARAREEGKRFKVHSAEMSRWFVYRIAGEKSARAKVLVEEHTDRILGAHIYGESAAEDIHIFAIAIRFGVLASQLREMVYAYPTFASALPHVIV